MHIMYQPPVRVWSPDVRRVMGLAGCLRARLGGRVGGVVGSFAEMD